MEDLNLMQSLLSSNQEKAEMIINLRSECSRLHAREGVFLSKALEMVKKLPKQDAEEFVNWLAEFTSPVKKGEEKEHDDVNEEEKKRETMKRKRDAYKSDDESISPVLKLNKVNNSAVSIIQGVQKPQSLNDVDKLENRLGFKFSNGIRSLLTQGISSPILLTCEEIGFYEVYRDDDMDGDDRDDRETRKALRRYSQTHDADDEFVCQQLCGERNAGHLKRFVLPLIGLYRVKVTSSSEDDDDEEEEEEDVDDIRDCKLLLNVRKFVYNNEDDVKGQFYGDGLIYKLIGNEDESDLICIGTANNFIDYISNESIVIEEDE